jgi:hypothetical protein
LQLAVTVPSQVRAAQTFEPPLLQADRVVPCGAPVTAMQLPIADGTSHAWHWPPHALLQQ